MRLLLKPEIFNLNNYNTMETQHSPIDVLALEGQIVQVLQTIYDPEIPVDIYRLGMIYKIRVDDNANVIIVMTLTTPNCPVVELLPIEVKAKVAALPNINSVDVELTFDPPWSMEMMSDSAKLDLWML